MKCPNCHGEGGGYGCYIDFGLGRDGIDWQDCWYCDGRGTIRPSKLLVWCWEQAGEAVRKRLRRWRRFPSLFTSSDTAHAK